MSPLSTLGTFKSQNKIKFPPKHNLANQKLRGHPKLSEPFNHPAYIYSFRSGVSSKLNMLSTKGREEFLFDVQFKHPVLHLVIRLCV